jgi:hypothetical protein
MQNITPIDDEANESWPRDFDIRAQYAEQQELLNADFCSTPGSAAPRAQLSQGNYTND